jgi:hypothetical protein
MSLEGEVVRLDGRREFRECHTPAGLVVSGRYAGCVMSALQCGICRLELVHLDNLLVRHELHETAVVRVGVRGRFAGP